MKKIKKRKRYRLKRPAVVVSGVILSLIHILIKYSFSGGFYFGKNRNKWRKTAVWQCMYPRCEKCSASGDGGIPDE